MAINATIIDKDWSKAPDFQVETVVVVRKS
jgi:hypothetical protein